MEFRHFVQLIAIGLQARIPMHITGFPGVGKTEFTKSLEAGFAHAGIKCKVVTLIGSIREPQDFGGFPVSTPDGVRLLPMAWALLWELWIAVKPRPIADDFLKLLDTSFGRDWRNPFTWPWARMAWAYGFTLVGATSMAGVGLAIWMLAWSSGVVKPPTVHVDTSQSFRVDAPPSRHAIP